MNLGQIGGITRQSISNLSAAQSDMIKYAPEEMQKFLTAQMKMQKEQEITQLITQMMKSLHEMGMSVIKNIG